MLGLLSYRSVGLLPGVVLKPVECLELSGVSEHCPVLTLVSDISVMTQLHQLFQRLSSLSTSMHFGDSAE